MSKEKNTLIALTAAAMLLPGIAKKAEANPLDQKYTVDFRHTHYEETPLAAELVAEGSTDRYVIDVNHLKFKLPLSEDTELSVSALQESMTGASPWYVVPDADGNPIQVMSGATIAEDRMEVGMDFRSYHNTSETTVSVSMSDENDYRSFGFGFSGALRFNANLSTMNFGINTSKDYIDASDTENYPTRPTEEIKNRIGAVFGISHIATKSTLIGTSVSYAVLDGFLSDAYKLAYVDGNYLQDSRPDSHEQITLSVMLREYFDSLNAALHLDYRLFTSNWGIDSHTGELSWHQNLGKGWQLIPTLRYYQQTQAEFYRPFYTGTRADGYYSSDYRLSEFTAMSGQVKLQKTFEKFYVNLSYETYEADGDHPSMLTYELYALGAGIKF